MNALRAALARFPSTKVLIQRVLHELYASPRVSSDYVELKENELDGELARLRGAWLADVLPKRQRVLVDRQISEFRRGAAIDVFDVMVKALRELPDLNDGMSFLEVGCSSGYYSEVLEVAGFDLNYVGCDYSRKFVEMAREKYPVLRFDVEDATALSYGDASFDVVVSGCCLLHIPEYERAIVETARVARRYAIFHRTTVVIGQPTKHYRKLAYGVETLETHFNEQQFLTFLIQNKLEIIGIYTLSESTQSGVGVAQRTYVCRKSASDA